MTDTKAKTAAKANGDGMDARRRGIVDRALGRFVERSFAVGRRDSEGRIAGRESTIAACVDGQGLALHGNEIVVGAVAFDGTRETTGRPVRLVVDPSEARELAAALVRFAAVIDSES